MGPTNKYAPYLSRFMVNLPKRAWPGKQIEKAPHWCSVDLRDGNQALINPMNVKQKLEMFELLLAIGFKEIEIGFPSASAPEYHFTRTLIEKSLIPSDVTPQVLTQAREHLIRKTFDSLVGCPRAIVHLYNSTSEIQRRVVFRKDVKEIIKIAVDATKLVKELAADTDTDIVFQYSPESFTGTELSVAKEVCEAVLNVWQPSIDKKAIVNLPATVEMSTPNVYADQIEWFIKNVGDRSSYLLSLHTHNDRGTGVAATELGLLAGADRVEGTLFGNGERTGNVDIVTLAMNLYSQGIDPLLQFNRIEHIKSVCERLTNIEIHPRHPYAGELVFTAFSGSHQDAINKGMKLQEEDKLWEVPYIPIDPKDIGRHYDAIVRINSQSGKGGVAYIMLSEFGCDLPKAMHPDFGAMVQKLSEKHGSELLPRIIWQTFQEGYLTQPKSLYTFKKFRSSPVESSDAEVRIECTFEVYGKETTITSEGSGPLEALIKGLQKEQNFEHGIKDYYQHARSAGEDAESVSYICLGSSDSHAVWGVGIDKNIERASVKAVFSALNRCVDTQ